jgi:UDPglucose--hexose-1-phosphate uridylyltransferase
MKNHTEGKWEKRWHPLREEWVVYSAHRNSRPWQGGGLIKPKETVEYDPACYLCPGNARIHGHSNPVYKDVFIFENDHPVVGMGAPEVAWQIKPDCIKKQVRKESPRLFVTTLATISPFRK